MVNSQSPYILFVQHGWHDTNRRVHRLGHSLADAQTEVIAPNLGLIKTWWRMEPLVAEVERVAIAAQQRHPDRPWRIVGHSMGGLIWLELLQRHPDWWPQVASVSLVSSPVGGADLGRIFDPYRWGIGIARDLGTDRRQIAEQLAQHMPIQTIASDYDGGSDGTVPIQCSQFRHARYTQLSGIRHDNTKDHPAVITAIQDFWAAPTALAKTLEDPVEDTIIAALQSIPGMTDAHRRDFDRALPWANLDHGFTICTWRHPLSIHHVFLADEQNRCRFAGFVGWPDTRGLYDGLTAIKQRYSAL
ncbi:alpha/beta hydrolase [Leptolyngbya cf. ectocarpi LEGE 11479]|uniref:Alpha/beta hydrolase n=1 Tax=Leptolyngbya cf. ectocarpi LEGE 11479 TaxID=1828722 RepID=A0A928WXQ1_LEPEC|nr:alpha/beta hydrolase [Leptolyngbya ectocarpi]MBE9065370.1 alpha/beta hydrolase [Leptolyngbya cf. ectocarpi LEGE 11479]